MNNGHIKILRENFEELSKKLNITTSQRELTVKCLADILLNASTDLETVLESFKEFLPDASPREEITFFSELSSSKLQSAIKSYVFIGSNESTPAGAHSKIAFVKNKYTDIAFEKFSSSVANAKPVYSTSFKESCESVASGSCEFCILPIANSTDGRLISFYTLLDRYDLKICEVFSIEDETAQSIYYARVGRSCKEPSYRHSLEQEFIFEFSILSSSADFTTPLLLAAEAAGARLISIDSIPIEYTSTLQSFFFSFSVSAKRMLPFRLFVAFSEQSSTPLGLYQSK